MKFFKSLPLMVLALVLIVFAVTNRQGVVVTLWPLPFEAEMPVFLVFFLGLFAGLALAGVLLAFKGVRHYFELRKTRKEQKGLSSKVDTLEQELASRPRKHADEDYTEEAPEPASGLAKRGRGS